MNRTFRNGTSQSTVICRPTGRWHAIGRVILTHSRTPENNSFYVHDTDFATGSVALTVSTKENPAAVLPAIRAAIQKVNPELVMTRVSTAEQIVAHSLAGQRFATLLMFVFAALGTLLAAVGLYGVLTYAVSERTQEIDIRMALGAQRSAVLKLVLKNGIVLTLPGVAIGIGGAAAHTRLIRSQLYGGNAIDPLTFVIVAIGLIAVTVFACWLPARRASRVDPTKALRYE